MHAGYLPFQKVERDSGYPCMMMCGVHFLRMFVGMDVTVTMMQ